MLTTFIDMADAHYAIEPDDREKLITALRQALAQPNQKETSVTNREAMKQAMYLIDAWQRGAFPEEYPNEIEALRQALAQGESVAESANYATNFVESKHLAQPEQEPAAWLWLHEGNPVNALMFNPCMKDLYFAKKGFSAKPLYTAPASKPWVSLTDEGIRLMCHNDEPEDWNDLKERQSWREAYIQGAKAAQDELRSKNNG